MFRRAGLIVAISAGLAACAPPPDTVDLGALHPAPVAPDWADREERITLSARPGTSFEVLVLRPKTEAVGGMVVLTGGSGKLDLANRPRGWPGGNFLVRSRMHFAAEGFAVATVDAPSDQPTGMSGFRLSSDHVADIADVVARLRQETKGKIWLIGTSMGTVSAANAGRTGASGADGVVLTSTVTRDSLQYPFSALSVPLEDIRIPALVVHHYHDSCFASLWSGTEHLMRRLVKAPRRERLTVVGGDRDRSSPCEAFSAHGYIGIEAAVVALIAEWMKKNAP
ncbi:MAG: alpha/beta hydrolase [Alphaproteobacteria bacterium]|nr:alpha/beta hydrolase [Alphaproteobacteria bacterium]